MFSDPPRVGSLISLFKGRTPPPKADDKDFDDYITKIIGPSRGVDTGELTPSIPGTPSLSSIPITTGTSLSGRVSRQSNEGSDRIPLDFGRYTSSGTDHAVEQCVQLSPSGYSRLTDVILALSSRGLQLTSSISSKNCSIFLRKCARNILHIECHATNPVRQERVLYNKEVQTRDLGEEKDADAAQAEAELRERILRERLAEVESAAAREKELDEESVRLEKEIEADIRGDPDHIPERHHTYRTHGNQI